MAQEARRAVMEPIPLADQNLHEGQRAVSRVHAFTISSQVDDALRALSLSCLPDEACGLLVGPDADTADELHVMQNIHEPPRLRRYRIDPLAYADVDDRVAAQGRQVVGIFHSHPPAPAVPSQFDLDGALPGLWYVIHGYPDPQDAAAGEVRAWILSPNGDRFVEAPLIISRED